MTGLRGRDVGYAHKLIAIAIFTMGRAKRSRTRKDGYKNKTMVWKIRVKSGGQFQSLQLQYRV
jgi:hypothetical protein